MASERRLIDYLPVALRKGEGEGESFLSRFLGAFEAVFGTVQAEIDALSDLFALVPTPALAAAAEKGQDSLALDSVAGLCPGDVLQIGALPEAVEFAIVKGLPAALGRNDVALAGPLRFSHAPGTPVRVVGAPGPAAALRLAVVRGDEQLVVEDPEALRIACGRVLRLDEGEKTEFVLVSADPDRSLLTVTPSLTQAHEIGSLITVMCPALTTTPPPAFAHAPRRGPEIVLTAGALAGEIGLELDAARGLVAGDVLHLRDPDAAKVEFARVTALPDPSPPPGPVLRFAVRVAEPLRFRHDVGTPVSVLGEAGARTELAQAAAAGAAAVSLTAPDAIEVGEGAVLRVDEREAEHVQVTGINGHVVTVTPALRQPHTAGAPVSRVAPAGSGTSFLSWLAGWIGLALRPDRGERWNRQLLLEATRLWPWRGTRAAVEAFVQAYLAGEAEAAVYDQAYPLRVGVTSTVGEDTVICGRPHFFWVEMRAERRRSRSYCPEGRAALLNAAQEALRREKPAHTWYALYLWEPTMQIGEYPATEVGTRVGVTTLLGDGWLAPITKY